MTYPERKLGDLLMFQRGFDITKQQQSDGLVPIVSSSGVSSFHNESKVAGPGVVIGRKGSLGTVHYLDTDYWPHDTTLWVKDFKANSPRFLSYFLATLHLEVFDTGSSNPTLNRNHVHKIRVQCAPAPVQRKIAAILATYDDLIANNRRRIALLEGVADEIYREWFVRMRFPGHQALGLNGLLPQGWTRRPLGELTKLIKRGISPDYSDQGEGIILNQKCIRDGKVSLAESRCHETPVPDEKLIRHGDVLINSTGVGTLGRVAVFDLAFEGITCDSHVTILRPDERRVQPAYLGPTVAFLQGYFESMAAGSTGQAELSRELIARTKVMVPTEDLQRLFAERVTSMMCLRRILQDAAVVLADTRDALLPRLISGRLKVDHLDIRLPPSMRAEAEATA